MKTKMMRVTMLASLALLMLVMLAPMTVFAASCTSTGSGNWSVSGTWTNCNGMVPQAGDDVTIAGGHTVTVDTDTANIASLTVDGTLQYDATTGRTITVSGDITIGGTFRVSDSFSSGSTTQALTLSGSFVNNGTWLARRTGSSSGTRVINVAMNGASNVTLSGTAASIDFNKLEINLGAAATTVTPTINVNFPNFVSGALTLTRGKWIQNSNTTAIAQNAVTIGSAAAVSVGGGTFTVTAGSLTVNGALEISSGTLNVGNSVSHSLSMSSATANVQISGGTINISGRWDQSASATANITGGTINVSTAGQIDSSSSATFSVTSTCVFTMGSGNGTIRIYNANKNTAGDLYVRTSTNLSAGTIIVGNGGSTTGNIKIQSTPALYNLTIDAGTTSPVLAANLTVNGVLTLTSGDLNTSANTLTLGSAATVAGTGDVVGNARRAHTFDAGTNYQFNNAQTLVNFNSVTNGASPTLIVNLAKVKPSDLTIAVTRTYAITPSLDAYTATLRLGYKDSETGGMTEANLRAWRHNGTRWVLQTGGVDTANNYVYASNVITFSTWAITDNGGPTAVMLSTFNARTDAPDALPLIAFSIGALIMFGAGAWWTRRRA